MATFTTYVEVLTPAHLQVIARPIWTDQPARRTCVIDVSKHSPARSPTC